MAKQLRGERHQALMTALIRAREKTGMTQRELAKRMGRSHSFVGRLEKGERQLNVLEFWQLAEDVFKIDPIKLFRNMVESLPASKPAGKKKS